MSAFAWLAGARQSDSIPKDIYASHVEALFSDAKSLFIGVVAACLSALVTGIQTDSLCISAIAIALAALGAVRLRAMKQFSLKRQSFSTAQLRIWEMWYVAGGSAHLALLGLFCLASFTLTDEPYAQLASIAIALAYLIGTPGRSFANDLLVNAQILAAGIPMLAALLIAGPKYWFIIAFIIVPFFIALKTISTRLRGIFMSAVLRARDLSALATKFDTALNNMPQGLVMFEADGKISVANSRLSELLRLTPEWTSGTSIEALLAASGPISLDEQDRTMPRPVDWARDTAGNREWVRGMADGRSIAFKMQAMGNGGGLVIAEDVTERMRAQASINYLARFDVLTSLPNRNSFSEHVQAALRSKRPRTSALFFVDLDQFKQVNDTLGHVMGDKLLQKVAERLRRVIRPDGMVARFGGDEFVLFQDFNDVHEDATQLAVLIIGQMSEPFEILGHKMVVGASIGIAVAPDEGGNVDDLLRDADLALYRAKAEGRRKFRFFEGKMQVQAQERRDIEKDLREALSRDELRLYYQPIFDLKCQKFTTCEALIRWQHPKRGLVPPSDFIPIAEEMGLISEIGDWVLHRAARECAKWPGDVKVAVNVSATQFRRGGVVASATKAVSEAGIRADRFEIEITETALLQDLSAARTILLQLRETGIRLSLDDFGTGYSSLSYLRMLPLNKVKLDRSFLQGLSSNSRGLVVLRGIARLCVELGMSVVMEGVETAEQLALVADGVKITEIQGYYYSRPLPAEQLLAVLQDQRMTAA